VDVVVCATASPAPVLTGGLLREVLARREPGRPLVLLDLAVPRDVAAEAAELPGVTLVDLGLLGSMRLDEPPGAARAAAEAIVSSEVGGFLTWLRGVDAAPTVAALRARADEVVEGELARLGQRRPDLTDEQRAEVARAVHRVVRQLLHSPSVRVRQLATTPGGDQYVAALRELFDLSVPAADGNVGRAFDVQEAALESTPPREDGP
jgi:glutamyl-tRNA reductase